MKLFNIAYKNGSNEIELFEDIKAFGKWWSVMVRLSNRRAGTVKTISPLN